MKPVINRMRRVRGQLERLEQAVERRESCEDIIPQFLAVKGAINAALAAYLKDSLVHCKRNDAATRDQLISALTQL
jgi:DNA-binding FrmR family transcriptional regulator